MKYDAFISYRRDGGFFIARLIRDRLTARGLQVFMDLEELRSGEFNTALYEAIKNSTNFLLILPKGALDRCVNEDDWVRKEILTAIQAQKNIIPVMDENFDWPTELHSEFPEELSSLQLRSGIKLSQEYLEATIDRLISFMQNIDPQAMAGRYKDTSSCLTTEQYFRSEADPQNSVLAVDMAFHAGAEWFTENDKIDILYDMLEQGIHLNILLNTPEAAEVIASHMRHTRKRYISFEDALKSWTDFAKEHRDQVSLRTTQLPLLRRYYSFHMSDPAFDTVNVKYYTYGNANTDHNYHPLFHPNSAYFSLYRNEFAFLWKDAFPITEELP